MRRISLSLLAAAMLAIAANAVAAVSESELQIAARALSFMANAPSGTVRVGIVFNPDNPQSAADAALLEQLMASGLRVGNATLQPVRVPIDQVGGAQVGLFFLTEGTGPAGRLSEVANQKKLPCVTFDLAQVRGGACAIGIHSGSRVEILVNRAAAESSGVSFSTAFRMLITEF